MEAKYLQVIAKYQEDLKGGLSLLYELYGRSLYQYSLKNWALDEEECYEVLYKTLETVGKVILRNEFDSERHFQNWLFKIHRNNTLMAVRAKMAKEQIEFKLVDWQDEFAATEEDSEGLEFEHSPVLNMGSTEVYEEETSQSPLFLALEKALQEISETDRDILLLRMNNYSYDDIAAMLGIENNQLKVRFLRAKAKVEKKTLGIIKENMS
ncbi:sigma-70 family RNA polymerase sigma factor [Mucilaginibacter sp. KACC 22773]|uniref:RNA polymerase sigma factor n=1 Tax=Mucilaginibacter sp. KACC 22773 TaxID=3025671 RepID=UPI002366296F|nr:sigma-70 family RNA polymerase sigma factor [Mucilaginibacter sp. KACC 22773]WDF78972.1 sigma-70 family RNA polymerase sigma factor [Mucilaginibacter sp. KACC 22773]